DHREGASLLDEHRVVTLVGPGGIGKTRLATELTSGITDSYEGGVLFSELSGATERDDIGNVVASQLGFESIDALRLSTATTPTLVVLDNCESALRQASDLAATLVDDEGHITVLATSRAPLQIYGERIYVVDPLELPRDDLPATVREASAARLFLDRAEAAGATWPVTDENLLAIGHLVRQLDGLPLAIELAAARSRMLTPPELVEHLDRQLDLLAQPTEGATARHSSLRGAIQTSYDPLPDDLQAFFRALSIFAAPFDLELAHGLAGTTDFDLDTLDRISQLVDSSLVDARQAADGTMHYRLLDSIRAFGLERLDAEGEEADVCERYVAAVVAFADHITAEGLKAFTPQVLGRIRDRYVHLIHAIELCIERDPTPDRAYRLFVPMYGPTGSRAETAALGHRMRDAWTGSAPLQAEAFAVLATTTWLSGDTEASKPIARQAIDHPDGSPLAKMIGHRVLGFVAAGDGDSGLAMDELQQAIDLAQPFSGAFARELQASWGASITDPAHSERALDVLHEASTVAAANDELVTVMWAGSAISHHHVLLGDLDAALVAAERALTVSDDTGIPWSVGAAHRNMALVLTLHHQWERAQPHLRTAFDATLGAGDIEGVVVTLRVASGAASFAGQSELADELWSVVPLGRGRPIIASFFRAEEDELERRLGSPTAKPTATLIQRARDLLGPPAGSDEPTRAGAADSVEAPASNGTLRFNECELDLDMRELRRRGERVHIEPQVYDLLVLLIERRGTVVSKNDILDAVWGDRFVSESALTSRIKSARKATGDDGRTQGVIRTAHGHGYSFVAEVAPA
ncbi:MAG: winged helix-turn-helix domain-containing protein, partial [Acidimicrobiia bacterium]|nr:winged helix-turn-helix domain-containing protein [Acidimicrobiia bacterium]